MRVHLATGAALAAMLVGTAAGAVDWDTDASGSIDREEFGAGAREAGVFESWDADRSGFLDREEFYTGIYGAWDADDDAAIDRTEFGSTGIGWFSEEKGDFDAWDANADNEIGGDEFGAAAGDSALFETWGGSEEGLSEGDFYRGLYGTADYDRDEAISDDEDAWFDWF